MPSFEGNMWGGGVGLPQPERSVNSDFSPYASASDLFLFGSGEISQLECRFFIITLPWVHHTAASYP